MTTVAVVAEAAVAASSIKVAFARNQAEAEMIQGLLSESGIPSILKRSGGFDNPEFLAAGPHDVMVNAAQAQKAREVLAETMIEDEGEERAEMAGEARLARGEGTRTSAATPGALGRGRLPRRRDSSSGCSTR